MKRRKNGEKDWWICEVTDVGRWRETDKLTDRHMYDKPDK